MKLDISLKCGTIYRYGPGSFIFGCEYCEGVFCTTREIADHIDNHFLTKLPENTDKGQVSMQTDLEIYSADANEVYSDEIPMQSNENFEQNFHATDTFSIGNDEFNWPTLPPKEIFEDDFYWPTNEECERNETNQTSVNEMANVAIQGAYELLSKSKTGQTQTKFIWPSISLKPIISKPRPEKLTRSEIYRRKKGHESTPIACPICGKIVRWDSYRNHVLGMHSTETNYKCDICSKTFILRKRLSEHFQQMHKPPKPKVQKPKKERICDQCGKTFKCHVTFYNHRRWKHSPIDERSCKCRYCDKTFRLPSTRHGHENDVHLKKPRNNKKKQQQQQNIDKQEQEQQTVNSIGESTLACDLNFLTVENVLNGWQ